MKRIKYNVDSEIVIEKSRFISYLFKIDNESQANETIKEYKKKYSDATHVVYAYRIGIIERSNDDNEPKGTAGVPTLELLRKNDLDNILCITIRYFGGIKLGAPGLLRAYINSAKEALSKTPILNLVNAHRYILKMDYKESSYFDSHYNKYLDINKSYDTKVIYNILIKNDDYKYLDEILQILNNKYELSDLGIEELYL